MAETYKKTTVVFPRHDEDILLGMKKRGFGAGWWNGFGGKLEPGESYEDSARRETLEEVGVTLSNLVHLANLCFYFDGVLGVVTRAYSASFDGTPKESEEMRPQFFQQDSLPFDEMWPGDKLWIPQSLSSKTLPLGFMLHFTDDTAFKSIRELAPDQLERWF